MDIDEDFKDLFGPGFKSLDGFCQLLEVDRDKLLNFLYNRKGSHYVSFLILKKNKTHRCIKAPIRVMKKIQHALLPHLEKFYSPKPSSHGFVKGRNVKTNAQIHSGKRYVFNIDLKDFFESIHFGRVRNLFMAPPFSAPYNVATVMAHICCSDGKLAQGSPTSPLISNMICRKLDSQIQALAKSSKCHFTRYADDITFSFTCTEKYLPKDIVEVSEDGRAIPGCVLEEIIKSNGFIINSEKTRLQHRTQRQMVTGLVVNEMPNVTREFIRLTSSMINALKRYGPELAEAKYLEILKSENQPLQPRQTLRAKGNSGDFFIKVVKGRLNYIQMIRGRGDKIYRRLAYEFTVAIGKENLEFKKSPEEILGNSIFVVNNIIEESQGTAFLLDGVGIVTNEHVVTGVSKTIARHSISFKRAGDTREYSAELILSDKKADLAIFHPNEEFRNIPALRKSDKTIIRPTDPVLSIGFPKHRDGTAHYIAKGHTTQRRRQVDLDLWLVDFTLMEGNSGGPMFNDSMEVIGITARGARNNIDAALYGFIPLESLNSFINRADFLLLKRLYDYLGNGSLSLLPRVLGKGLFSSTYQIKLHKERLQQAKAV
ncbi:MULTISPECIES: reverse transcriptase domain-containing protein [Pseudomonas]|uniref:reverse transcriptase domain-containing protein n=1 Tax=Pseudomonas TaxID=286 RepID=UPI00123A48C0|nr:MULTISPECIES: reverse transcriptase domain-containing protein [Pseudomonas]QEU31511.1 trypsin-like serine protease [Pseudomonas luteola]QEU31567.1 trypsin-like serine protease [Pseudomonas luteola]